MITSSLIITVIIAGLLVLFRAEVKKLVNWVISFKRVARTSEGFSLESTQPDLPPVTVDKREQVVIATEVSEVKALPPTDKRDQSEPEKWSHAFSEKRYDDAIRLLSENLAKEDDPDKRLLMKSVLGHIKFEQDVEQGVAYFDQLISDFPEAYQPYEWLAYSYYWRGLHDNALTAVERGLRSAKEKSHLYDVKTDCLVALGRDQEAIEAANKTIECDPSAIYGYSSLAKIYQRANNIDAARSTYKRALTGTSGNETILRSYAAFLSEKELKDEAVLRYTELVKRQPKSAEYRTLLGNAYLNAGFNNLALVAYKKGNDLAEGKEGWIHGNIGNLYKNQGFYTDAIVELKEALRLEPDSQYAHERLAQAQQLESDEDEELKKLLQQARAGGTGGQTGSSAPVS